MSRDRFFPIVTALLVSVSSFACPEDVAFRDENGDEDGIWEPGLGTTWQWQLSGALDMSFDVEMYVVDLFGTPEETIAALQDDGRIVICHFSAGAKDEQLADADSFEGSDVGNEVHGDPDRYWVDIRSPNVREIMTARLDVAESHGCDGVAPDDVDGWDNDTGFELAPSDQVAYNRFLAREAHDRGLSVGLRNAVELVGDLVSEFDWALNEECLLYDECAELALFIEADKAVFHVEYVEIPAHGPERQAAVCGDPAIDGFSTLIKTHDLDAWSLACE